MKKLFSGIFAIGILLLAAHSYAASDSAPAETVAATRPTIVLVHGAFADSSSWNGVITRLKKDGYPVMAVANPLRGLTSDAAYLKNTLASFKGSVVLVGHSYGGAVITEAAARSANVKALVYVGAFAPEAGEDILSLSGKYPGSTLGETLAEPVQYADGAKDLYIQQDKFHAQFAADVDPAEALLMAAAQRPVSEAGLTEKATDPAWKHHPSWFIYGDADKNIPPKAMGWMASRAGSKETVVVKGASHVVMISHPDEVATLIEKAASAK